ncbi:NuoI/complex I 23 kDa subunit family protein [Nonomuraea aurantiaca]|uniref:NuoI/complex I 23 kDa subunit family protein n=1 Tax=Nonomuraea aurantiaca TaxID=2878562 RepID=UPI001CD95170|nr:NADH-quinone oxidoreductase subunit I [Nonomuraea aurantiaca]MCA2229623.1 4Fe-4S binding protein [Nonomuraea aurantiaca]
MLRKSVTQQYPEVKPALPSRSRGVIALVEENCTSCMLCARECPDWCIYIDSHKETLPAPEGGRPRQRNVLDRFAIDFALCMYCGICIEVCPFDALFWSPEFEYAEGDIRNLLHEKDRLATWVPTVLPPPAHDPGAEPPKELTAARRPARTPSSGRPGAAGSAADRTGTASDPAAGAASEAASGSASSADASRADASRTAPGPASSTASEPAADTAAGPASSAESGPSSTGRPSAEDFSTGSGQPSSPPGRGEQTSGTSRRGRRMADPRSIRPPGRLDPEKTRESEEDS